MFSSTPIVRSQDVKVDREIMQTMFREKLNEEIAVVDRMVDACNKLDLILEGTVFENEVRSIRSRLATVQIAYEKATGIAQLVDEKVANDDDVGQLAEALMLIDELTSVRSIAFKSVTAAGDAMKVVVAQLKQTQQEQGE